MFPPQVDAAQRLAARVAAAGVTGAAGGHAPPLQDRHQVPALAVQRQDLAVKTNVPQTTWRRRKKTSPWRPQKRKKADRQDPDLTLKLGPVSGVPVAANNNARRVNHDLPVAPQPGLDLPRAAASLQPQDEQVVVATETDQDPLPDVDPLAGEPQVVGSASEVGANREETLGELQDRGRDENTNFLNRGAKCQFTIG